MSLDTSSTAAAVVGIQQSQQQMHLGISMLKQAANAQQAVASSIISAADESIYTASGRAVTAPGQLINGRG